MQQALLDIHKTRHPNITIINDSDPVDAWPTTLAEHLASANPPDVFTLHSGEIAPYVKAHGANSLHALNDFFAMPSQSGVLPNIYSEIISEVTVDGKIYALPVDLVRANLVFYNKHVFKAQNLEPPTTIEEFQTVCQKLKTAGVTPVGAMWPAMIFQDILPSFMGIDAFASYMHGGAADETALRKAVDLFADVLDNYIDPSLLVPTEAATEAGLKAFMTEKTAMYVSGDWIKGTFDVLGWTSGIDYQMIDPPGAAGVVVYTTDVFAVSGSAPHLASALDYLDTVGSIEGQTTFNKFKGSAPIRKDIQSDASDPVLKAVHDSIKNAKHLVPADTSIENDPVATFVYSPARDKEALVQAMMTKFVR